MILGCRRVDLGAKYVGVVYLREDPDVIDGSGDAKESVGLKSGNSGITSHDSGQDTSKDVA